MTNTLFTRGIPVGSVEEIYTQVKTAPYNSHCFALSETLNGNPPETDSRCLKTALTQPDSLHTADLLPASYDRLRILA
jgi:hypothetical protein